MVSGVSVQVSGAMKIQKTKGNLFLFSVICYLTPIIKPCFVNCLRDTTLARIQPELFE
jgi:hypothetical protein